MVDGAGDSVAVFFERGAAVSWEGLRDRFQDTFGLRFGGWDDGLATGCSLGAAQAAGFFGLAPVPCGRRDRGLWRCILRAWRAGAGRSAAVVF